jgi:hypothetical protein
MAGPTRYCARADRPDRGLGQASTEGRIPGGLRILGGTDKGPTLSLSAGRGPDRELPHGFAGSSGPGAVVNQAA